MKNILILLAFVASSSLPAQIVPAPTEKQAQSIENVMAPHRAKIKALLDADKSGKYESYKADVLALFKEEDLERRAVLEAKIKRDHYAYIKGVFASAKIDLTALKQQVAAALGHNKFSMDEFGGISSQTFLPPVALPTKFTAEFNCPLATGQHESNCSVFGVLCGASASDCKIEVSADAVGAGGSRSKGSLGDKFDLSGGPFSKMTVSSQSSAYYSGGVESLILGYSQFNAKLGVRLQGPGLDKITIVRDEWCVAPLLWYKTIQFGASDYLMQATFTGSFSNGTTYTAQAYAEAFGLAIGLASGGGRCQLHTFDFVKAKASN